MSDQDFEMYRNDLRCATREWCLSVGFKCGNLFEGAQWIPEIYGIHQWVRLPVGVSRATIVLLAVILELFEKD